MELVAAAQTNRPWLLRPFRALARHQITKSIKDPELRRKVTPSDEMGCKRVMITDDWYPTLTKANVELVTDPIAEVTPTGIRAEDGTERPAEVLVLATGFKMHAASRRWRSSASAGARSPRSGRTSRARTSASASRGSRTCSSSSGRTPAAGAGSVIYMIEAGMRHVIAALEELERAGARRIEIRREAAEAFDRELRSALAGTVWHSGCTSYYLDENGNNPSMWPWRRAPTGEGPPASNRVRTSSARPERDLQPIAWWTGPNEVEVMTDRSGSGPSNQPKNATLYVSQGHGRPALGTA